MPHSAHKIQPVTRLYLPFSDWFGTKRTTVRFQINRKMVNTIWFWVDLTRFRKYFSACKVTSSRPKNERVLRYRGTKLPAKSTIVLFSTIVLLAGNFIRLMFSSLERIYIYITYIFKFKTLFRNIVTHAETHKINIIFKIDNTTKRK